MEIVPAQPAGHIHHLAHEIEPRHRPRLHGSRLERRRIHPAQRHLGGPPALGPRGGQLPVVQGLAQPRQSRLRLHRQLAGQPRPRHNRPRQAFRQIQRIGQFPRPPLRPRCIGLGGDIAPRRQIDADRLPLAPIAGDLQDRRPRKPPMGKEQALVKADPAARQPDPCLNRQPGQSLHPVELRIGEGQRHQPRARLDHRQAEAAGNVIAQRCRPHLGDRLAPGRHHQRRRLQRPLGGRHHETGRHALHRNAQSQLAAGSDQVAHQQVDDLTGRAVAEKLSQSLLVPGDSRLVDPSDEIVLGEAAERRQRESRICREEALRGDLQVGEIAPPPARDADFLARRLGVVQYQHPPPAPRRLNPRHQPRRPGAQHDHIPHCRLSAFRSLYRARHATQSGDRQRAGHMPRRQYGRLCRNPVLPRTCMTICRDMKVFFDPPLAGRKPIG